jgi:SAM-dependent methyltransferase
MGHYRVGEFKTPHDEVTRLAAQAELIAAHERAALHAVGVPERGRGVEIGCGPGFFAAGLARSCAELDLWGVDVDPFVVREARQRLRVIRGDANALPFAESCFDFAYSRLFLRHVSDPAAVLAGIVSIVKPGGCVAAIDVSDASLLLDPVPADFAAVVAARRAWFDRRGGTADMGHKLPRLFARAGLADVQVTSVLLDTSAGGPGAFAGIVLTPFLQAADSVLDDPARMAAATAAVKAWSTDTTSFGTISLFVVGGRRPL